MKIFIVLVVVVIAVIVIIYLLPRNQMPLSFSYSSMGVVFEVSVNGKTSAFLSSGTLQSSTGAVPLNFADFKVRKGTNSLTIKIVDIAPDLKSSLNLVIETYQKGDIIEAGSASSDKPLLLVDLTSEKLKKGAQFDYTFDAQ